MELNFQESRTDCLELLFHETVAQEETAEIIVPEGWQDIGRVVNSFATIQLRQKEVGSGVVTVSGGIRGGILYVPEGEEVPKLLQTYVPFTVKKEQENLDVKDTVQCHFSVSRVDARMLNSRKAMLRVSLSCRFCAYTPKQLVTHTLPEETEGLMTCETVLPMRLCMAAEEKGFVLNEEVLIPDSMPAVEEILEEQYRIQVTEKKMIGSKAVFKGSLGVHTLYLGQDSSLSSYDADLPFSQYMELNGDLEDCEPEIQLSITGAELETDGQLSCHRLLANINLVAQCAVFGICRVPYISDAYSITEKLIPEYRSISLPAQLDHRQIRSTMTGRQSFSAKKLVDIYAYPEDVIQNRNGETVCLQSGANVNLLYYDNDNKLQGKTVRLQQSTDMKLSPMASCRARTQTTEPCTAVAGAEFEIRCEVETCVDSYATQEIRGICGGKTEPIEQEAERPSLILRRVGQDESLWSIAKDYRTTVKKIMEANSLPEDSVLQDRLLLIPM